MVTENRKIITGSVADQKVRGVIDKCFCQPCVIDNGRYKIIILNVGAFKPSEDVCWVNVRGGGDLPPLKPHPFYIQVIAPIYYTFTQNVKVGLPSLPLFFQHWYIEVAEGESSSLGGVLWSPPKSLVRRSVDFWSPLVSP